MEMTKIYEPKSVEPKWQAYWEKNKIYRFDPESKKPIYSVDTPPPTISGLIHIGHAFSYSQAEFIVRFKRMNGFNVFYPFGFDDNGLPTERYVEQRRNIKATDMKRSEFVKICLEETKKIEETYRKIWTALGISCDWSLLYSTINELCQKTSQRSFIDLYKKNRIYRKEAPTMWCTECQTAIAQAELRDREIESNFVDLIFELETGEKITISTTRPEMLPACVSIFVNPGDKRYKNLVGKKARVPLFNHMVPILTDERADPEKGTGIVMCCTFGDQTDMEWWLAYNLPVRIVIDKNGLMNEKAGEYKGLKIRKAREKIIEDLKKNNLIVKEEKIVHSVNAHERCGTEIEFLVTKQWFIRYLDLKNKFLELGRKIKWYPSHMRTRYENWIKGLQWDWCISRQRYFGVPFPVWYCRKCQNVILPEDSRLPVDPLQDKPKKKCSCGSSEFEPEKDVMDTWMTSSMTPEINARWEEDEKLFKKLFPMSLRPQAHDIISLWAFNTIVKAYLHEDSIPWKDIMISGHGLDEHGKKMSKSKGNVIEPQDVIKKYSADALRFWAASASLGEDMPYQEKDVVTGKKFVTKLWNASKFCLEHFENFDTKEAKNVELKTIDKWLLTKLNKLTADCTKCFNEYQYGKSKALTEQFFWHVFCDNYLEMAKYRLYQNDAPEKSKFAAQHVLYYALLTSLKLMAPIVPHVTEEIYQLLFAKKENKISIHVSDWPKINKSLTSKEAEDIGDTCIKIVSAIRQFKTSKALPLNKEIREIEIETKKATEKAIEKVADDIKGAMKIGKISFKKVDAPDADVPELKLKMKIEIE